MSDFDLIIRGGTVAGPAGVGPQDLGIKEGVITGLSGSVFGSADSELDASGLYIFPGLIDPNVQFNDPGHAEDEGFESGSQALAAGGFTSFFDGPGGSMPPVLDREGFIVKYERAKDDSLLDFGLWGGLTSGNLNRLEELHECGVIGFRASLCAGGEGDLPPIDDGSLVEAMLRAADLGQIVAVHAENDALTAHFARRAVAEGRLSVRDYLESRPIIAELEAIQRTILFAWEASCAVHLVGVSTGQGVELIASAKAQGLSISCETCPHYLILTEEDAEHLGTLAKCAPPLRSTEERAALWEQLKAGNVDLLSSAHAPCPPGLKHGRDLFAARAGITGGQSTLPLLLTEGGRAGGGHAIPLERLVELLSTNVAQRFRLHPAKGEIALGADGDLVIFDLDQADTVTEAGLLYRHPENSPYLGRTLRGQIRRTILRGQTIYKAGAVIGKPTARLLRPMAAEEAAV